jgi:hypothetical protein
MVSMVRPNHSLLAALTTTFTKILCHSVQLGYQQ